MKAPRIICKSAPGEGHDREFAALLDCMLQALAPKSGGGSS
jgi:hypothetical protein